MLYYIIFLRETIKHLCMDTFILFRHSTRIVIQTYQIILVWSGFIFVVKCYTDVFEATSREPAIFKTLYFCCIKHL